MPAHSIADPESARSVIRALAMPAAPDRRVSRGAAVAGVPVLTTQTGQALTVGSQFTEFAAAVPADLRMDILNSFLFAQLAANAYLRAIGGGSREWYERFIYVLANGGWNVEMRPDLVVTPSGDPQEVYREILPILQSALGDAAERSVVLATLRGLATVSPDRNWITLFDRESQRASSNQFQIGYVDVTDGMTPRTSLTLFELDAHQSVTRCLFFKVTDAEVTLRGSAATLSLNAPVFSGVKDLVEERIREHLAAYVADVQL